MLVSVRAPTANNTVGVAAMLVTSGFAAATMPNVVAVDMGGVDATFGTKLAMPVVEAASVVVVVVGVAVTSGVG